MGYNEQQRKKGVIVRKHTAYHCSHKSRNMTRLFSGHIQGPLHIIEGDLITMQPGHGTMVLEQLGTVK